MQAQLDIKRTTWVGYEAGKSQPYIKELVRIAAFFGVTETDLLHSDLQVQGNLILKADASKISKTGNVISNGKGNLNTVFTPGEDVGQWVLNDSKAPYLADEKSGNKKHPDLQKNGLPAYIPGEISAKIEAYIVKLYDLEDRMVVLEGKKNVKAK